MLSRLDNYGQLEKTELISYIMYGAIIHILLVASVQTTSVHLGPSEVFRNVSDVIFPGEFFILQCVWDGLTTCNISMFLNGNTIYEEGGFKSNEYVLNKISSSCSLNISIHNVTLQHKGLYKCRVQNGDTTMEDAYELNVVTESAQCLTKCNESDNSVQLFCYTFSRIGQSALQTWEIIEPGNKSTTFVDFTIQQRPSSSVMKNVGVSHSKITKENLTDGYKCAHSNYILRSCVFNFNSPMIDEITSPTPIPDAGSSGPSDPQSEQVLTGPVTAPSTTKRRVPQQTSFKLVGIGLSCAVVGFIVPFIALLFTCYKVKERKNASKTAENEENENPAASAAYSMKIYNTTDKTMYETVITNNTNNTYDYADQSKLNTRELPRQSYGTPTVQQYETVQ